jgi:hypothetical protein
MDFPDLFYNEFIIDIKESYWFLYCDSLSSYFAEFISSKIHLVEFKGFSKYRIIFLLDSLGKISSIILNKSGKNGHTYLVPEFRGNVFSFSPSSKVLAMNLSYISFIMLRYNPSIPTSIRILSWRDIEFYQRLFMEMSINFYPWLYLFAILCLLVHIW